jgi:PAS domain-containing protein
MPSGVVIVDDSLKIIESNARFIEIIGGDASIVSEADPDLEGAYLERLISFHDLFATVLKNGSEVLVRDIHHQGKILRITIFSIQPHQVVGGILQDITEPVIQREQIIQKAGEVMKKNLTTVQQIAFLLGENAADSEVLLNSIIQSFSGKE